MGDFAANLNLSTTEVSASAMHSVCDTHTAKT